MHCVFSTKDRRRFLTPEIHDKLQSYLGGICRNHKMKSLITGGVEDHVHILLSIPSTMSVAKAVQTLKGNSSKWIHETFRDMKSFEWQDGYGAFSIGVSGIDATTKYIQGQVQHHKRKTFKDEFRTILKKHGLEFEEWMLD